MPKLLVSHHAVSLAQLTLFTLVGAARSPCKCRMRTGASQCRQMALGRSASLSAVRCASSALPQVRSSPSVFESFGFPPGVTPALAGFILFQQLIGPRG